MPPRTKKVSASWHVRGAKEILESLVSFEEGISSAEAEKRLETFGFNKLGEPKREHLVSIFLRQFKSPLIYILLIASVIVYFLGESADTLIILGVLVTNACIGAFQEGKAQDTLRALRNFTKTPARVLRDGKEYIVEDIHLVPGDMILLEEGDKVSADARIIEADRLKVNESALTGESESVFKIAGELKNEKLPTADQKNMLFKGTFVVAGSGKAVVVATGLDTVIGKIARSLSFIVSEVPLTADIRRLSRVIGIIILALSLTVFIAGVVGGNSLRDMFFASVAIAVSAIPEGLPIVITLVLATGVYRMGKQHALVKRLQAVDALGYADVIAVDKTGTVTKNELMVEAVYVDKKEFEVGGEGYEPKGDITLLGDAIDPLNHPELVFSGKIASLGSSARVFLSEKDNTWQVVGDPTEAAIVVFGKKVGFHKDELEKESPPVLDIPASSGVAYHATLHDGNDSMLTVFGAPETILDFCDHLWVSGKKEKLTQKEREEIETEVERLSGRGLRVIGAAVRTPAPSGINVEKMPGLTFVALYGMSDVLRPGVKEAIFSAQSGGVRVVMITGDHKVTARAIAKEAGIWKEGDEIVTGKEIEEMEEKELLAKVKKVSVFARVTPQHKLSIIKAYKKNGHIIAMTGDGVNDALSLVAADLGVAMGKIGTEVTKEASDIILLDDNFKSIVSAIEEGRSIYQTIKKVLLYLFSTGIGEVFFILFALFLAFPLPLLPTQILWLNLVTDGFLVLALAMEPKEKITRKVMGRRRFLIDSTMVYRMLLMGLTMTIGTLYLFGKVYEMDIVKGWTVALTSLAVFQWLNAWNCRSETDSIFKTPQGLNRYLVMATLLVFIMQLFALYHPVMQRILHTVPLSITEWIIIVAMSSLVVGIEEFRKIISRRFVKSPSSNYSRRQVAAG